MPFAELPTSDVPTGPGEYFVVRSSMAPPAFLDANPAGWPGTDAGRIDAESVESAMIADFIAEHGALPFANRKRGRRQTT